MASPLEPLGASTTPALVVGDHSGDLRSLLGLTDDVVVAAAAEALGLQLEHRVALAVVDAVAVDDDGHLRSALHCALQHLRPHGHLLVRHAAASAALLAGFRTDDLLPISVHPLDGAQLSVFRRGPRVTVHDLLAEARATIRRVTPMQLCAALATDTPPLVVDTRTHTDRARFQVIPGAVHIPRTVLEWHLDPANGYLHPAMRSFEQPLVIVCNGGYSSSLAAANLVRLGFTDVADLIGGHTAWLEAGLPVAVPDHSHLDTPGFEHHD
ncbi:MAG: rhodanese-like domain-containing protein [Ilumatobacteraceae bacterium]